MSDRPTPRKAWLIWALAQETDACLLFPLRLEETGYARVCFDGRRVFAHVWICEQAHGAPPAPWPLWNAAHACANSRHCCNKRHLSWKTSQENQLDKIEHGTMARGPDTPRAVLSPEAVRNIRGSKATLRDLADALGCSISAVHGVRTGRTWSWVT